MKIFFYGTILSLSMTLSIPLYATSFNYRNNPWFQIFNNQEFKKSFGTLKYETKLSALPKEGSIASKTDKIADENSNLLPWSDTYWPHYLGGVSSRWSIQGEEEVEEQDLWNYNLVKMQDIPLSHEKTWFLSPTEKYDLYMGNTDWKMTKAERVYSKIQYLIDGQDYQIDPWAGICNAWAESTYTFKNPDQVVVKGKLGHEIVFFSSDIKGLLASSLDSDRNSPEFTIGTRCYDTLPLEWRELDSPQEFEYSECNDVNAGAFHLVMGNLIGLNKQAFILDITRDSEVWNQAGFRYISEYDYNNDKSEVEVTTRLYYVQEIQQQWRRYTIADQTEGQRFKTYHYKLELSSEGEITGGSWLSYERPDYIFVRKSRQFKGEWAQLKSIYQKSIN